MAEQHPKVIQLAGESLIDAAEASDLLKLHPRTVKRLALAGELPAMRIGRVWRFRVSDLDRWISAQIDSNSHPRLESEKTR